MQFPCGARHHTVGPSAKPRSGVCSTWSWGPPFQNVTEDYCRWYWKVGPNLPRQSVQYISINYFLYQDYHIIEDELEYFGPANTPFPADSRIRDIPSSFNAFDAGFPVPPYPSALQYPAQASIESVPAPLYASLAQMFTPDELNHHLILAQAREKKWKDYCHWPEAPFQRTEPIITRGRRKVKARRSLLVVEDWFQRN
jgi:hypothetical protein